MSERPAVVGAIPQAGRRVAKALARARPHGATSLPERSGRRGAPPRGRSARRTTRSPRAAPRPRPSTSARAWPRTGWPRCWPPTASSRQRTRASASGITRNLERRFDQRHETLLLKFIDILDNLDRALEAAADQLRGRSPCSRADPRPHPAPADAEGRRPRAHPGARPALRPRASARRWRRSPSTEPDHDHLVVKELMRGYRLNGRVARAVAGGRSGQYRDGGRTERGARPSRRRSGHASGGRRWSAGSGNGEPTLEPRRGRSWPRRWTRGTDTPVDADAAARRRRSPTAPRASRLPTDATTSLEAILARRPARAGQPRTAPSSHRVSTS